MAVESSFKANLLKLYQYIPYFEKRNENLPKILCVYKTKRNKVEPFEKYYFSDKLKDFFNLLNESMLFLPFDLLTYDEQKEIAVMKAIRDNEYSSFTLFEIRAILTEIFIRGQENSSLLPRAVYDNVFLNCLKRLKYLDESNMLEEEAFQYSSVRFNFLELEFHIEEEDIRVTRLIADNINSFKHEYKYLEIEKGKYFSRIAGVFFHYLRDNFLPGTEAELLLVRETHNPQDKNAIAVFSKEKIKFGYFPKDFAELIAPMIDKGEKVSAYIADFKLKPLDAIIFVEIDEVK